MIGIIGGFGDIGCEVVKSLWMMGYRNLLVGGRHNNDMFHTQTEIKYQYIDLNKQSGYRKLCEKMQDYYKLFGIKLQYDSRTDIEN